MGLSSSGVGGRSGLVAAVVSPFYRTTRIANLQSVIVVTLISFLAAFLVIVAWVYKSGLEESFLLEHFGSEYEKYQRQVKRFIPYVW